MRQVSRSEVPRPVALSAQRLRSAMEELSSYFRLIPEHRRTRRPPLRSEVWTDPTVRSSLLKLFHQKCAYCEQKFAAGMSGLNVDHYRPLWHASGNEADGGDAIDHYAWLAYEWNNLIPSCRECNGAKSNAFPTSNDRAMPLATWSQCDRVEKPLLLNPCRDKPSAHLCYSLSGECHALSERGAATIWTLGLNRPDLAERRRSAINAAMLALQKYRARGAVSRQVISQDLSKLLAPASEFSGALTILLGCPLRMRQGVKVTRDIARTIDASEILSFVADSDGDKLTWYLDSLNSLTERVISSWGAYEIGSHRDSREKAIRHQFDSRITDISLRNLKGIGELRLKIGRQGVFDHKYAPATALLGENSCGKSSILQAVALALMPIKQAQLIPVETRKDFVRRSRDSDIMSDGAEVKIRFSSGQVQVLKISSSGKLTRSADGDALVLGYGAHRMFGDEQDSVLNFPSKNRTKSLLTRNSRLPHSAAWLRNEGDAEFEAVSRAMREILSLRNSDEITRDVERNILVDRSGEIVRISELSDGYRSLFAMALDIMRNMMAAYGNLEEAKGYVLIDEIELHLHPRWKMQVVDALRQAMPGVQFIFTTHDPLCLRGLYDGEAHVLVRDEAGEICALEGLPDVRLMRAEQILTSEYFGLSSTSDPKVAQAIELRAQEIEGSSESSVATMTARLQIGDSIFDQMINEGVRRHVAEARNSNRLDTNKVREEAVQQVLEALRKRRKERAQ